MAIPKLRRYHLLESRGEIYIPQYDALAADLEYHLVQHDSEDCYQYRHGCEVGGCAE